MVQYSAIPLSNTPFIELLQVDSTNNYAMQLVQNGTATHGTAVFTGFQTAGKGQRGKQWHGAQGENIALSVLLNTGAIGISRQFALSAAVALAAHAFFTKYCVSDASVKWPNDIYWRDRKAGGILIENVIRGQEWQWAIVGIGLNINQSTFDTATGRPVSLKQITGKQFDVSGLAKELASMVISAFDELQHIPFAQILDRYNDVLFKKGEQVKLKKDSIVFECTIEKVNASGELEISGAPYGPFRFGEVEWMIGT
ncbi:biotin--[acetyl-CoA-carboxylase] ligase [Danxiaibacter flavus]|uniref:Biotin--[acetyl-CoA-carboxylase] ligase n=1 Tax=Danxiaibacter flavus TaxID=3049108 RepID=A0ABV3ZHL3_9BACT|nr:biotin--[acetyl-CoA-carboxylase] ligase [Chitinophagaceae bacterium DXS]